MQVRCRGRVVARPCIFLPVSFGFVDDIAGVKR